jgi:hypothetical protein
MERGDVTRRVLGQPSWTISTPQVEAHITRTGGHVAPVAFRFDRRTIEPFHVAPWAEESLDSPHPPIVRALRGDFFCMPFGGNGTPLGRERHSVHGEVANAAWKLESIQRQRDRVSINLSLRTRVRKGRVDKQISLIPGQRAVYSRHVVSESSGPMCFGHHAMLRFPDEPRCGVVSTSPFAYGQVFPEPVERPENRGYSILKPGAQFRSLQEVRTLTGQVTDLSRYPDRRGYEDLVLLAADAKLPFAWTAVTFPKQRYVWFALRNPRVLRSTILWMSNGGRHYPPWNGRHVNVMGLEEVTANFHYGLAESVRPNPLSRRGITTCVRLVARRPLVVNYIMAVAEIPRGFDRVLAIEEGTNSVLLRSASGRSVEAPLDIDFLSGKTS